MAGKWSLKQVFLRTLIVALAASALIGIYSFLFGQFGPREFKILVTTLSISYFSITSLACGAAFEAKKGGVLASIGFAVSILGFLVFVPGIWTDWTHNEVYGKLMWTLAIFAFSFAQICLLALVPLKQSARWLFFTTVAVIFALAIHLSGWMILEFRGNNEWLFRIAGVLGILDGCGSIFIPVVYKLGGKEVETTRVGPLDHIELSCPRCNHREVYSVGTIKCRNCSLEIRVDIPEESQDGSPSS